MRGVANRQHNQRDLWVGLGVGLMTTGLVLSVTIWAAERGSAHVGFWPRAGEIAGLAMCALGVYLIVALVCGWWLPGGFAEDRAVPASTVIQPLRPHYEPSPPYCRPASELAEYRTEHHVGLKNPDGNPVVTGVRLEWTAISPQPRVANPDWTPGIPYAVPRDTGGDPAMGIDLPPGRQELWAPISTWIGPDGLMAAREFPVGHATTRGDPNGFPYRLQPGDRLRFTYRIVTNDLPPAMFSLVITAADGHVQCDLEG
jgi:hypothetical protein